jgi:hypothetical protein
VHDRAAVYIHGDDARTNYEIDAARQSNQRQPPTPSWRVMSTLETLAREARLRKLGASSSCSSAASARVLSGTLSSSWAAAAAAAAANFDASAQQHQANAAAMVPWTLWALSQDASWTHAPSPPHPVGTPIIQRGNVRARRARKQQQQQQRHRQQSVARTLMTIASRLL